VTHRNNRGSIVIRVERTHDVEAARKAAALELRVCFGDYKVEPTVTKTRLADGTPIVRFSTPLWMERHCSEDGCAWFTRQSDIRYLDYFERNHREQAHPEPIRSTSTGSES